MLATIDAMIIKKQTITISKIPTTDIPVDNIPDLDEELEKIKDICKPYDIFVVKYINVKQT